MKMLQNKLETNIIARCQFFSMSARYMQVLVGLQCVFFPVVATLLWHFRQGVKRLPRNPTHLECCLALLAVSLTLRNCELYDRIYHTIRLFIAKIHS